MLAKLVTAFAVASAVALVPVAVSAQETDMKKHHMEMEHHHMMQEHHHHHMMMHHQKMKKHHYHEMKKVSPAPAH